MDQQLETDFRRHEAVCAERWKTVFNQLEQQRMESQQRVVLVTEKFDQLNKLIYIVGASMITGLAGILMELWT